MMVTTECAHAQDRGGRRRELSLCKLGLDRHKVVRLVRERIWASARTPPW